MWALARFHGLERKQFHEFNKAVECRGAGRCISFRKASTKLSFREASPDSHHQPSPYIAMK